ncbi:MAG: hypothetical protein ACRYHQ_32340 [Janthinobacterium lividum]
MACDRKPPRPFARYGSLPKANGRTRSIARLLAEAKARGEVMTDAEVGKVFAISPLRVARHRKILGQ